MSMIMGSNFYEIIEDGVKFVSEPSRVTITRKILILKERIKVLESELKKLDEEEK